MNLMSKVKIVPCSGIGKSFGLMAREAALLVTDVLEPDIAEIACLAHIVSGAPDGAAKVKGLSCITIDGCNAYCSAKSVEHEGGLIKEKYRTIDEMKNHRGKNTGTGGALSEDGWVITKELAEKVAERAREIAKEDEQNG